MTRPFETVAAVMESMIYQIEWSDTSHWLIEGRNNLWAPPFDSNFVAHFVGVDECGERVGRINKYPNKKKWESEADENRFAQCDIPECLINCSHIMK